MYLYRLITAKTFESPVSNTYSIFSLYKRKHGLNIIIIMPNSSKVLFQHVWIRPFMHYSKQQTQKIHLATIWGFIHLHNPSFSWILSFTTRIATSGEFFLMSGDMEATWRKPRAGVVRKMIGIMPLLHQAACSDWDGWNPCVCHWPLFSFQICGSFNDLLL